MRSSRIVPLTFAWLVFAATAFADAPKPAADIAAPPGIDKLLISPRTGDALKRAQLPLDQIIAELERPAYLPKASAAADPIDADPAARADHRIVELKAALEKNAKDRAAASELLRLFLIDKDDPAAALPYLELAGDPKLRLHLPLAAKPREQVKEAELMDLGIWYQELGNKTQGPAGVKMLKRAYSNYEAFLKSHTAEDIQNSTARVALLKVHQAIEARAAGTAKPRGPTLHVQRTYARARAAWRQGQPHVAVNLLEAANNLAPNQPEILRMLGEIYFSDLRNAVQGAHYLKQVIALEPNDLSSLFLLGRYEYLHLRQWKSAIVVFAHALTIKSKDADPAVRMLVHHYLGRALQNESYDAASIDQFQKFLAESDKLGRPTRFMQEVALFSRTLPVAWQQVGDSHNRLGNPAAALDAYRKGLELEPDEPSEFVNRIAYTQLRLGQGGDALKSVIELVKQTSGDKASLQLLKYLIDAGASAAKLADELKRIYEQLDRPAALAQALANMQGGDAGRAALREHLLARPGDREVLQALLAQLFAGDAPRIAEAIRLTAEVIAKLPAAAERYGNLLLDAAAASAKPADVLAAVAALDAAEQAMPMIRFLKAMALLRAGKDDAAIDEYARAVAADPSLVAAQASLVTLLVDRKEYERAAKVLDTLKDTGDPRIAPLRVRVLRETGKADAAEKLIEGMPAEQRRHPLIVLELARLQLMKADEVDAIKTLEDGVDANPASEELYEALLDLLDAQQSPEAERQVVRLTERMLRQIPQSKVARVRKAQLLIRTRDIDGAERVLRDVQREDPTDARSLALLIQVLFFTDRKPEADELMMARLKAHPTSEEVHAVALQLVRIHVQAGTPEKAMEFTALLLENKAMVKDPRPLVTLTRIAMVKAKKFDNIDAFFKKMIDAYPQHWADLMSDWALTWEYGGDKAKTEKLLEEVLAKEPNHAKTNNALGYTWADQGKNLERAQKMIAIALKEEPDSAAYLDSMGWVKYKLGEFDEAIKYLEKARIEEGGDDAVILDHLGDALFRAGRQVEALQWWIKAQQGIDPRDVDTNPEMKTVSVKLREKIGAVRTAKEPPTAEVPGKAPRREPAEEKK